jgi:probable rRNA maturation factor
MPKVIINASDVGFRLNQKKKYYDWIERVIVSENLVLGSIAIIICSDEYLLGINRTFLNHDYYTDIITFDYCEGVVVSGELYISIDRVRENANHLKVDDLQEFARVLIHGVLHLCGYKDKSTKDVKLMRTKEDEKLKMLFL